ncbi:MAG: hypothetical protein V7636_446 [Actinomycetota bacterium]
MTTARTRTLAVVVVLAAIATTFRVGTARSTDEPIDVHALIATVSPDTRPHDVSLTIASAGKALADQARACVASNVSRTSCDALASAAAWAQTAAVATLQCPAEARSALRDLTLLTDRVTRATTAGPTTRLRLDLPPQPRC